jgi:hypothetical protein
MKKHIASKIDEIAMLTSDLDNTSKKYNTLVEKF